MTDENIIKRYEKGLYHLDIVRDEYPEDPRDEMVQESMMFCWHDGYNLGDEHGYETPCEFLDNLIVDRNEDWEGSAEDVDELLDVLNNLYGNDLILMPLYLFDHGGITISTTPFNCPWDSGPVGFICTIPSERGFDPSNKFSIKMLTDQLEAEVKDYDDYLRGDHYGFYLYLTAKCKCCGNVTEEVIDSCFGFTADTDSELISIVRDHLAPEHQFLLELDGVTNEVSIDG